MMLLLAYTVNAQTPTTAGSGLSYPAVEGDYLNLHWQNGNGARRIIVAKEGSPVTGTPQNGIDYAENTAFGSGATIAPGEFVVYDHVFTSFYLTNLKPSTHYYFKFFEYNGTGAFIQYLTTSTLTGDASTVSVPTQQASNITASDVTGNSLTLNWQSGNGGRRLVIAREGAAVNADPVDLQSYGPNVFGSGAQVGPGNYSVYANSGNSTAITNLKPNTQYYFSIYEYNGIGQPVYKLPGEQFNVTTFAALPIKLSSFTANESPQFIQLLWRSESEINGSHYSVQRSGDGIMFNNIAEVKATNTSGSKQYIYRDNSPLPGKSFYRLLMVDKDGSSEYSPVITVTSNSNNSSIKILANPVRDKFIVQLPGNSIATNHWRVINMAGQVLKQGVVASGLKLEIATEDLQAGPYFFQVSDSKNLQTVSFLRQ